MHPVELPEKPLQFASLIGGRFVRPDEREIINCESPSHGVVVSRYPRATPEDIDRALRAARAMADGGTWAHMPGRERRRVLARIARLIDKHRDELALIETLEGGRPIGGMDDEIQAAIEAWEHGAALAGHVRGDDLGDIPRDAHDEDAHDRFEGGGFTFCEAAGVVGMIMPSSRPLCAVSQKLALALAAGNSVVVKPSERAAGTTLRLGELLVEAGLPEGVVNIVAGDCEAGRMIAGDGRVDMIAFTGSRHAGRAVGRIAGEGLRRFSFDIGVRPVHIVFADADIARAARGVADGIVNGASGGVRLLVERRIAEEFGEAVFRLMAQVRVGDPFDPATQIGPLISRTRLERINGHVEAEAGSGAEVRRAEPADKGLAKGHYLGPTLLSGVKPGAKIEREEIFGPILVATPFETPEAAVRQANGMGPGVHGGIWTGDIERAFAIARQLDADVVTVNGHDGEAAGRGRNALDAYSRIKTVRHSPGPVAARERALAE